TTFSGLSGRREPCHGIDGTLVFRGLQQPENRGAVVAGGSQQAAEQPPTSAFRQAGEPGDGGGASGPERGSGVVGADRAFRGPIRQDRNIFLLSCLVLSCGTCNSVCG